MSEITSIAAAQTPDGAVEIEASFTTRRGLSGTVAIGMHADGRVGDFAMGLRHLADAVDAGGVMPDLQNTRLYVPKAPEPEKPKRSRRK